MENRLHLDLETEVPLGLIDPSPWNPKFSISGVYKKGLENSLSLLGNRDRLHLWPNPENPSRYYAIDGNQRIAVMNWLVMQELIRKEFELESDARESVIASIYESSDNQEKISLLRSRSQSFKVPCQIVTRWDETTPFTLQHAKIFPSIWNRNHAKFDEVKQAEIYREVLPSVLKGIQENQRKNREMIMKSIIRPELPHVEPLPLPTPSPSPQLLATGDFTPTEDEPWGPPPPPMNAPINTPLTNQSIQLIPMVFSFTPEGYTDIDNNILKSKSRVFRETTLKSALEKLERLSSEGLDNITDSIIVETALRILNVHIESKDG